MEDFMSYTLAQNTILYLKFNLDEGESYNRQGNSIEYIVLVEVEKYA